MITLYICDGSCNTLLVIHLCAPNTRDVNLKVFNMIVIFHVTVDVI